MSLFVFLSHFPADYCSRICKWKSVEFDFVEICEHVPAQHIIAKFHARNFYRLTKFDQHLAVSRL